jgi:hypothetical protein
MSESLNFTAGKQNYDQSIEDSSKQNYDRLNRTMVGLLTSIAVSRGNRTTIESDRINSTMTEQ